jgi:hypothetical protein
MGISKPKSKLTLAEIEEIVEQNTRLFKDGPYFTKYMTRLLMHLFGQYYSPGYENFSGPPPAKAAPVDASALPTFPSPRDQQKRGKKCPQCGALLNHANSCPSCGVFIR